MARSTERLYRPWVWMVCIALAAALIVISVVQLVRERYFDGALFSIVGVLFALQSVRGFRSAVASRDDRSEDKAYE